MNEWKVVFLIRGKDNIAVNVKSNNEMFARQNAVRKLLMQYQHLHLQSEDYQIVSCKLTKRFDYNKRGRGLI
jgi:hypothetical protein